MLPLPAPVLPPMLVLVPAPAPVRCPSYAAMQRAKSGRRQKSTCPRLQKLHTCYRATVCLLPHRLVAAQSLTRICRAYTRALARAQQPGQRLPAQDPQNEPTFTPPDRRDKRTCRAVVRPSRSLRRPDRPVGQYAVMTQI